MVPTFCNTHEIRFYGPHAELSVFDGVPIEYNSDVFQPDCERDKIILPVNRGQRDYEVHTHTVGGRKTLVVLKDGEVSVIQVVQNNGEAIPHFQHVQYC